MGQAISGQVRNMAILDEVGRIRLDAWELDGQVQDRIRELWADPERGLETARTGAHWFMSQVQELYGWGLGGVTYSQPIETDIAWPAPR